MYVGQWPIFHGPVILCCILKTISWANVIIEILDPCDAKIYLIKYIGSVTYISWFSDCLISWRLFEGWVMYWRHWFSVTRKLTWSYICQWPLFHGPVILCCILKTIWWTNVIIRILDSCDAKIYLIKCMWVNDLHFMIQLFWRILKTVCFTEDIDSVRH